jgi:hypothetical protein
LTLLLALAVLSLMLPAPPATVHAQYRSTLDKIADGDPVSASVAADDTDVAILVKYVGPLATATVAVAVTTSDMTFQQAGVADTTLECPVSGALGGIIDVSNAACNTLGEVVDIINGSPDWRAWVIDGLRTDLADARLLTKSATDATLEDGLEIQWDTSTAFETKRALTTARTARAYLAGRPQQNAVVTPNPFQGTRVVYWYGNATSTYATGGSNFRIYSVKVNNKTGTSRSTETVTTVLGPIAGGATTANKEFDFRHVGVYCERDAKCLVELDNSAAMSAVQLVAYGTQYRY